MAPKTQQTITRHLHENHPEFVEALNQLVPYEGAMGRDRLRETLHKEHGCPLFNPTLFSRYVKALGYDVRRRRTSARSWEQAVSRPGQHNVPKPKPVTKKEKEPEQENQPEPAPSPLHEQFQQLCAKEKPQLSEEGARQLGISINQ